MANKVVTVLEADGTTQTDLTILDVDRQAAATSKSVALATEDKAVLDAAAASLAALDNAVSGNELQVDVLTLPALPAGTNAIGKLAANSGVDIGDVDVASVTPGTTATALGKAEDAAHTSADTGVMALAVRKDSAASFAGTDGDYAPLQLDANGALRVTGASGATEYTEDAAAASNPAGPMMMAVRRDTLSASEVSADGDNVAIKATSKGEVNTHDADVLAAISADDVAHDAADSGKPVKVGAKAIAGLSTATLVAAADRTDLYAGLDGALIVHPHGGLSDFTSGVATCTSGANTSVISALGAGIKFYLTGGMIRNSGGSAGGGVLITDGSGGTTKADVPYTTLGAVFKCDPIGFTANTAVFADPTGSDTVVVTLYGFKSKV